ncbi:MAG TPA: cytochrome c oxidase subunit II [Blastocatellia bacterium]|nr:cytochrome c oxidase subunit II [Blastocatellia bacterium]
MKTSFRFSAKAGYIVLLTIIFLTQLSCKGIQSALDPAGPESGRINNLWWLLFGVCAVVFILVITFLFYALAHARRYKDGAPIGIDAQKKMTRNISICVAITVIILFVFLVASLTIGKSIYTNSSPDVLTIEVVGHQWWWEVHYPTDEASKRVVTANEIHIPVGQPVRLRLSSGDVIHSFWVPNLQGKMDLIPMHLNSEWIKADHPGVFRGQCAEFCGHQHAHMSLLVIAEPQDQFNAWMDQQRQSTNTPSDPVLQRGQHVFLSSTCILCHTIRGTLANGTNAPDLTHLASRQTIAAGTLPNNRGYLSGWVVDSQSIKPGNKMPPNHLNPDDLQALLTYLESLK